MLFGKTKLVPIGNKYFFILNNLKHLQNYDAYDYRMFSENINFLIGACVLKVLVVFVAFNIFCTLKQRNCIGEK